MACSAALSGLVRSRLTTAHGARRFIHQTISRHAITNLTMPAMSPTMTEGGISSWKKREGESFSAGDVLLEVETDKATIDVEAQDDGIMGKIIAQDGSKNVPVGKIIALLAEEGDDISNLEAPKEEPLPAPTAKQEVASSAPPEPVQSPQATESQHPPSQAHTSSSISHSRPIFPSVHRLISEYGITKLEDIKGTGVRGMLTKGDILAYLGKASSPSGTYKEPSSKLPEVTQAVKKGEHQPPDGPAIRRLIVSTMLRNSNTAKSKILASQQAPDFESIIADYLPQPRRPRTMPPETVPQRSTNYLDGLY